MSTPAYAPRYLEQGSPIAAFNVTLRNMVATRGLMNLSLAFGKTWVLFDQDITMLVLEGVTIGLRTPWVRRVAVPMLMAQKALDSNEQDEALRVKTALEILQQLRNADDVLYARCVKWMEGQFPKEEKPHA